MSRRKQSNPKPIKRPEDDDDDDGEAAQKVDLPDSDSKSTEEHADSVGDPDQEREATESPETDTAEREVTPPPAENSQSEASVESEHLEVAAKSPVTVAADVQMSPGRQEVMSRLNFPSDLLALRKVEEEEFLQTGMPWSVSTAVALPKGTSIGPYHGELVALSSIKPGELVLQFQEGDGEFSFIKVAAEMGAWLSLLKPAEHSAAHNTCVYFDDGQIWCETVESLDKGTELMASFTIDQRPAPAPKSSGDSSPGTESKGVAAGVGVSKKETNKPIPQLSPQHALIYGCPFCSVRFSSPRTLEAHLTYYCSKKPTDFVSLQQLQQRLQQQAQSILEKQREIQSKLEKTPGAQSAATETPTVLQDKGSPSPKIKVEPTSPRGEKRTNEERQSESSDISSDSDAPKNKSPKLGDIYKCGLCGYLCDKLSEFQRHQRAHQQHDGVEGHSDTERLSVSPMCQEETYCKQCNIQFSSVSTYKGHKEFYCQYRTMSLPGKNEENISETASPASSRDITNDLVTKMLQSPPTVVVDGSGQLVPNKGGIPSAGLLVPNILHSPLLLQAISAKDMHLYMKNHKTREVTSKLLNHESAEMSSVKGDKNVDISLKRTSPSSNDAEGTDQPLDLSKSKQNKNEDKKDVSLRQVSPKIDQYSIKSEQRSPTQLSPPAKKAKLVDNDTEMSPGKTPLNIPTILPNLINGAQVQYVNKKPIPPLQMVSRCVECNIVFYKHENYLIHKEHYCSGRRNSKDSGGESDNAENSTKEMKTSPTNVTRENTASNLPRSETEMIVPGHNRTLALIKPELKKPEDVHAPRVNEICYKFYCIPCKIRFSSAGNLKAHKDFYCPHGKENDTTLAKRDDKDDGRKSSVDSAYRCESCNSEFVSARLLKLHMCVGDAASTPLLRCLYCDYVTQTENRLSEHMKVHIPTKAFKCNLCGYRGNTARGMRMHGKMHMENGEEFTDDNMIEYEEPPQVPIQRNGACEKGPVDVETELIRMKNEPYKRRRSRKSFEKSENMVPFIGPSILPQSCAACGQTFMNVSDFVIHLRMHEIAALEAMKSLKSLRCEHCNDYVAESLTSLLVHTQMKHPEQLPGTSQNEQNITSASDGERSHSRGSPETNNRSRSNSVESSRTYKSSSSHERRMDYSNGQVSPEVREATPSDADQCVKDNDKNDECVVNVKKEVECKEKDEQVDGDEGGKSEQLSHEDRSLKLHDLVENSKSHSSGKVSHSIGSIRSHNIPSGNHEHGSPPTSSPSSPYREPEQEVSPRQPSPQSQTSPTNSIQLDLQRKLPSPNTENNLMSPKIEQIKKEEILSPKRLSPDPKTRYLLSQNALNIKQEQTSPPAARDQTPHKSSTPSSPQRDLTSNSPPKLPISLGGPALQDIPLLYSAQAAAMLSLYQFPPGLPTSLIPTTVLQTSPAASMGVVDKGGRKYCKHCDINFTYLSSFLTHKKYYCSARNGTAEESESTATA